MKILKSSVPIVVIATSLLVFASAPVAIRVEVEPLRTDSDGTRVALTVQVSPEDRARVGKNAMLRIELDGGVPPGQSPLWAVRIEKDGSGRIETVWPPGEHALRVEISNPSGTETGLWVGTVRISAENTGSVEPDEAVQPTMPKAAPTPEAMPDGVATGAAAAGPIAAATPEELPPGDTVKKNAVDVDEKPATDETPELSPESEAPPVVESAPVEEAPPPEPDPPVEPEPAEDAAPAPPIPVDVEPDTAVVEPLRSDTAPPSDQPDTVGSSRPESLDAPPEAPPADVAAAFEEWNNAGPGTLDLTVVVFRDRVPATGLTTSDFRLRVGGTETAIDAVGDAGRAPLQLGVAVDVATDSAAGWSRAGGRLFSLVQRTRAGRGHAFFAADGRVGEWDQAPDISRAAAGSPTAPGLPSLIVDSMTRFDGRRGRTFLVVVTDGRSDVDKAGWKSATQAVANAGVPVLVIALWDESFSHRVRKNLKAIADVSGGGLFLVQGSDQLDRAAERFGPMIDAGVALRFSLPPTVTLPATVSVQTTDKTLEISAPKSVR